MDPCIVALGGNGVVHRMMPPIELAERLTPLLALAVFLGLAFEEIYKRDEPAIPSASGHSRASGSPVGCFT
jgi:hypothetical protein